MSINKKENKTDGFVEDILSFDELQELEDLDDLQAPRKSTNNKDQQPHIPDASNLEEGELSECADEIPVQPQAQYLDSDHSDEEIMKQIQAKVKLSKKRRRNPYHFVAPAIISYNLDVPFGYSIPVQAWPNGFYPLQPKQKKQPVDLSLLDSDSDEMKETTNQKSVEGTQHSDPAEKEEGSIEPFEVSAKKKRSSEDNSSKLDRDRDRKRDSSESKKKRKKSKEMADKHHKKERRDKKHKEHRSRHSDD